MIVRIKGEKLNRIIKVASAKKKNQNKLQLRVEFELAAHNYTLQRSAFTTRNTKKMLVIFILKLLSLGLSEGCLRTNHGDVLKGQ